VARKANRGRGGKKISKVLVKEAIVDLENASRSVDCDADLSEEEENCENLTLSYENEKVLKLDIQSLLVENSSGKVAMEVGFSFPEVEDVSHSGMPIEESISCLDCSEECGSRLEEAVST
jgi:hypothetical protein